MNNSVLIDSNAAKNNIDMYRPKRVKKFQSTINKLNLICKSYTYPILLGLPQQKEITINDNVTRTCKMFVKKYMENDHLGLYYNLVMKTDHNNKIIKVKLLPIVESA